MVGEEIKNPVNNNSSDFETDVNEKESTSESPISALKEEPQEDAAEKSAEISIQEFLGQIQELNDKYLRLYAEFENYKKRMAKERVEFVKMAGRDVIMTFLPLHDDFERALKSMDGAADINAVKEGVQLIFKKFHDILQHLGVKPSESTGEIFDPERHEAISRIQAGPDKSGVVIDTIEKGFTLHDKILRFPRVVVGE